MGSSRSGGATSEKAKSNLKRYGIDRPAPTHEEGVINGRKAGLISAARRKEKANIARAIEMLLAMDAVDDVKKQLLIMGYPDDELTNANALVATLFSKAMDGDQKAADTLLNYIFQVSEDARKTKESEARIAALRNNAGDVTITSSDDEDGDVVIYLPKIEGEEEETTESE